MWSPLCKMMFCQIYETDLVSQGQRLPNLAVWRWFRSLGTRCAGDIHSWKFGPIAKGGTTSAICPPSQNEVLAALRNFTDLVSQGQRLLNLSIWRSIENSVQQQRLDHMAHVVLPLENEIQLTIVVMSVVPVTDTNFSCTFHPDIEHPDIGSFRQLDHHIVIFPTLCVCAGKFKAQVQLSLTPPFVGFIRNDPDPTALARLHERIHC